MDCVARHAAILAAILTIAAVTAALPNVGPAPDASPVEGVRVRVSFAAAEVRATPSDSPARREFAGMPPLTLVAPDYVGAEKISSLPRKLVCGPAPSVATSSDFTYYSPWGNLALFYNGFGRANGLYILGRIESGKASLAAERRDFTARIEIVE